MCSKVMEDFVDTMTNIGMHQLTATDPVKVTRDRVEDAVRNGLTALACHQCVVILDEDTAQKLQALFGRLTVRGVAHGGAVTPGELAARIIKNYCNAGLST